MSRVTADDLEWGAMWLETYERTEGVDDEAADTAERVAGWLRAEVARRREQAQVDSVVKATGASPARARATLRKIRTRNTAVSSDGRTVVAQGDGPIWSTR